MTPLRTSRLVIAAAALILCGAAGATFLLSDSALTERDRTRLDRAKSTHANDVARAMSVYTAAVDRANTSLDRVYGEVIRRYEQRGDTATATALRDELSEAINASLLAPDAAASDGAENPSGHQTLRDTIGRQIVYANGQHAPSETLAERRYVLLYFSAGWCGPCRRFTPQLASFYSDHAQSHSFEVLFVSSDRSAQDMQQYMQGANMTWPAIPYAQVEQSRLSRTYGVRGIPRLVILGQDGNVVMRGDGGAVATLNEFIQMLGITR